MLQCFQTSEMLERVARAIHEATEKERTFLAAVVPSIKPPGFLGTWEEKPESLKFITLQEARAAIEAMREPTREMIDVGNTVSEDAGDIWEPSAGISYNGPSCGLEVWQAMHDEALKGDGKES